MSPPSMQQAGAILVVTLLFTFIITLLSMVMIENSLLEGKMSSNFQAKLIAFAAAESALIAAEAEIEGQVMPIPDNGAKVTYHLTLKDIDKCLRKSYEIVSNASYRGAKVQLLAAYQKNTIPTPPDCPFEPHGRRLWWRTKL